MIGNLSLIDTNFVKQIRNSVRKKTKKVLQNAKYHNVKFLS